MDQHVSSIIDHMANSHQEMAKILEVKRDITVHMTSMITAIPDLQLTFGGLESIATNSMMITETITNYINTIADLEEAIAENLSSVMKEMMGTGENEE